MELTIQPKATSSFANQLTIVDVNKDSFKHLNLESEDGNTTWDANTWTIRDSVGTVRVKLGKLN